MDTHSSLVGLCVCLSRLLALQKQPNQPRCRLGCSLKWALGTMY